MAFLMLSISITGTKSSFVIRLVESIRVVTIHMIIMVRTMTSNVSTIVMIIMIILSNIIIIIIIMSIIIISSSSSNIIISLISLLL